MSLNLSAVPPSLIDVIYPMIEYQINRVIDKAENDISSDTTKRRLKNGETMLIVINDEDEIIAVNILEVMEFETGHRALYIPITAGERMSEWLEDFLKMAMDIAKDLNCQELRGISCRPGWIKALKSHGWYNINTVIGCKVE